MSDNDKPVEKIEKPVDLAAAIKERIQELSKELQEQSAIKDACQKKIKEIDTRVIQIVGAVHELQKLQQLKK